MIITNTPEETLAAFLSLAGIALVVWIIYGVIRWHELREGAPCVIDSSETVDGAPRFEVRVKRPLTEAEQQQVLDDFRLLREFGDRDARG